MFRGEKHNCVIAAMMPPYSSPPPLIYTVKSCPYVLQGFAGELQMTQKNVSPDRTFFNLRKGESSIQQPNRPFSIFRKLFLHTALTLSPSHGAERCKTASPFECPKPAARCDEWHRRKRGEGESVIRIGMFRLQRSYCPEG